MENFGATKTAMKLLTGLVALTTAAQAFNGNAPSSGISFRRGSSFRGGPRAFRTSPASPPGISGRAITLWPHSSQNFETKFELFLTFFGSKIQKSVLERVRLGYQFLTKKWFFFYFSVRPGFFADVLKIVKKCYSRSQTVFDGDLQYFRKRRCAWGTTTDGY